MDNRMTDAQATIMKEIAERITRTGFAIISLHEIGAAGFDVVNFRFSTGVEYARNDEWVIFGSRKSDVESGMALVKERKGKR